MFSNITPKMKKMKHSYLFYANMHLFLHVNITQFVRLKSHSRLLFKIKKSLQSYKISPCGALPSERLPHPPLPTPYIFYPIGILINMYKKYNIHYKKGAEQLLKIGTMSMLFFLIRNIVYQHRCHINT